MMNQMMQIPSKPRVTRLSRRGRHRSLKNQHSFSSSTGTRSSLVIHTRIRAFSWTNTWNNRKTSIDTNNIDKGTKSQTNSISLSRSSRSQISPSQVECENDQNKRETTMEYMNIQRHNTHEKLFSVNDSIKNQTIQSGNRSSHETDIINKIHGESKGNNNKRRKQTNDLCRCTKLCVLLSALIALALAAAIIAGFVSSLNKSETTAAFEELTTTDIQNSTIISTNTNMQMTTDTTTFPMTTDSITTITDTSTSTANTATTASTTITYAPTGIYALQIPTCATWNETGITVAGQQNGVSGSGASYLDAPVSIFVDNNYTLYVSDRENHRVMKYYDGASVGIIAAGNGTRGNSSTQLYEPKGVAVDQMGAILVGDSSNYRIQRFPLGSIVATTEAVNSSTNLLGETRDLYIDVNNAIYVTDSYYHRVVKFYPNNPIGVILAGNNGQGSAANQLSTPFGSFMGPNQTLYVADMNNHRIQKWTAGATTGITVAGVSGSSGTGLLRLDNPRSVIVDNNGFLYIVDAGNNRVVRWTSNYAAGGTCIVGCTGLTGTQPKRLYNPRDLKFDASGNLYVNDQGNNRIQKFMIEFPPNCSVTG